MAAKVEPKTTFPNLQGGAEAAKTPLAVPITVDDLSAQLSALTERVQVLEGKQEVTESTLEDKVTPFVGFVLNNWQTRPALLLAVDGDTYDLVVFTKGEIDGFENVGGYVIHTGVKRNDERQIPGTWHEESG